jgi:hypothetical protein
MAFGGKIAIMASSCPPRDTRTHLLREDTIETCTAPKLTQ